MARGRGEIRGELAGRVPGEGRPRGVPVRQRLAPPLRGGGRPSQRPPAIPPGVAGGRRDRGHFSFENAMESARECPLASRRSGSAVGNFAAAAPCSPPGRRRTTRGTTVRFWRVALVRGPGPHADRAKGGTTRARIEYQLWAWIPCEWRASTRSPGSPPAPPALARVRELKGRGIHRARRERAAARGTMFGKPHASQGPSPMAICSPPSRARSRAALAAHVRRRVEA